MLEKIRVLIVDDSPICADALCHILGEDPELEVVGVARDGQQAVNMTEKHRPQLVTMDVRMPVMDGLTAIERIMCTTPTPILVVTGDPRAQGDEINFEALRRGALDVMAKPKTWKASDRRDRDELRERVKLLSGVAVVRRSDFRLAAEHETTRPPRPSALVSSESRRDRVATIKHNRMMLPTRGMGRVVGIVASTGGPAALAQIFEELPPNFPSPVLVVQHISNGFCESFAKWLDDVSPLSIRLAEQNDILEPGTALLAPDGVHLHACADGTVVLKDAPPVEGHRPSGSLLLSSLAEAYGEHAIGVVLTGMGRDGVDGLLSIHRAGGTTIAQGEASCVVFGMPAAAIEAGAADFIVDLNYVSRTLCRVVESNR